MRRLFFALLALSLFSLAARGADARSLPEGLYAEFVTPRGSIIAELFFTRAPLTVTNFVGLAEGTLGPTPRKPFYDGLTFHRVVQGFVVQGGDPLGTGYGGPGYSFPDELVPGLRHDAAGVLSMANAGPDTNGSQIFFTLAPANRLNYLHSVFGEVIQGIEILPEIQPGDTITKVRIHRIGSEAEVFRADEAAFHALAAKTPRATPPHFDDSDGLLTLDPPRAKTFDTKLANVARFTGRKLYVRLFEKFEPDTPGQRPGRFTGMLAHRLGLGDEGVLATYFADIDQWGLWIAEPHVPQFMGRPGTVQEFTRAGAFHEAKQAFFASARAQGDAFISEAEKTASADQPVSPQQKTKLHVDAVIEALIFRFEPQRSSVE